MKNQVWKLAWNPQGYDVDTYEVDTSKYSIGDFLSLPRSFFSNSKFSCRLKNEPSVLIDFGIAGKDILITGKVKGLSDLAKIDVYSKLKLCSSKVIGKVLVITYTPLGDVIDPQDFGQTLNKDSDVEHKTLTTKEINSDTVNSKSITVQETLELKKELALGTNGSKITESSLSLEGISLSKEAIDLKENELNVQFNSNYIKYDPSSDSFVIRNNGTSEDTALAKLYSVNNKEGAIFFGSPATDKSAIMTTDWLYVDGTDRALRVPKLYASAIATISIQSLGHKISMSGEDLVIDDFLRVNSRSIKIGSLELTHDKIAKLRALLED